MILEKQNAEKMNIEQKIKEITLPCLTKGKFDGEFPHFFRRVIDHTDIISFEIDKTNSIIKLYISFMNSEGVYFNEIDDNDKEFFDSKFNIDVTRLKLPTLFEDNIIALSISFPYNRDTDIEFLTVSIIECLKYQCEGWWIAQQILSR